MSQGDFKHGLMQFFLLTDESAIFKEAIHPKSCGGENSFKFLALIGDNVLNLILLAVISANKPMDTGELTEYIQAIHNKKTLIQIAQHLKIPTVMEREFETVCFTRNDLKESIEALLGATYQIHGLEACKQVIINMVQIVRERDYFNPNPIGILQMLFQKKNIPLPEYHSMRVGGPDHQSKFQCIVKGNYEGKNLEFQSDICSSKKEAERDAAKRFLKALGEDKKLDFHYFLNPEKNT
jgi:dsRNA-specific ribonuclease